MSARTARAESFAWLEQRLDQWGAWRNGGVMRGLGARTMRWPSKTEIRSGIVETDNPAFDRVMQDIDRAVASLHDDFKAAIIQEHGRGDYTTTPEKRAELCGCSPRTYSRRLQRAYELLADELTYRARR